jgi:hypothetical protein
MVAGLVAVTALSAAAPARAGTWSPVTGATSGIQDVGQVRTADGTLHVVWSRQTPGGTTTDVEHSTIGADGSIGTPTTIATGFSGAGNPAIVTTAAGLQVFFGGIQCVTTGCPTGLFSATSADGGLTWSRPVSLFDRDQAYAADMNAATLSDGTPFETWWQGSGVIVHRGVDPATADQDFQAPLGAGCCGYYSNLAADAAGHLQIAWDSNATNYQGVWSQAVDPATGAPSGSPQLMPGSVTTYNGAPEHAQMNTRTPIVALPGAASTFFVAYPGGYPTTNQVLLWQVGSPTSTTIADESVGAGHVSLAADATGGLWVFWTGGAAGEPHVFARRVGSAGLEPKVDMGVPPGTQSVYGLDGVVSATGEPEALALVGFPDSTSGTYYTRGGSTQLPAPVLGESVNAKPVEGTVLVRLPAQARRATKGQGFVPLEQARQLPVGTQVDARRGVLQLATAVDTTTSATQRVTLSQGLFSINQSPKAIAKGLTTFKMLDGLNKGAPSFASCGARGSQATAAKQSPKVLNTLRAKDKHGKFRTKGRFSAATVRGTEWGVRNRCDGTLTIVRQGRLTVTDFARRKTIKLHAGQRYLAQAP